MKKPPVGERTLQVWTQEHARLRAEHDAYWGGVAQRLENARAVAQARQADRVRKAGLVVLAALLTLIAAKVLLRCS